MQKLFLAVAGLLAAVAVVLGALGAHSLKPQLEPDQLSVFETAVKYHLYHSLGLLIIAFFMEKIKAKYIIWAGWCFMAGVLFFSGSLYLLSTKDITGLQSIGWLGPVTPLGGLFFIFGWIFVFFSALTIKKKDEPTV